MDHCAIIMFPNHVNPAEGVCLRILIGLILIGLIGGASCRKPGRIYIVPGDGKYDSESLSGSMQKEFEKIAASVKKLYCIADYREYYFAESENIRTADLANFFINKRAYSSRNVNKSVIGTATIIYSTLDRIALLTCAHVLDFPDTLITYYDTRKERIKGVAFKIKQENIVFEIPQADNFEIIALDSVSDIAVLGKTFTRSFSTLVSRPPDRSDGVEKPDIATMQPISILPILPYKLGNSRELEWGCITYVIGYPLGNMMMTRGLVSSPHRGKDGYFLLDALFNRGMSGGLVLAVRDGIPNFEVVGMAKSVAADARHWLVPNPNLNLPSDNTELSYDGKSYVVYASQINYGITYPIPSDVIRQFFKRHQLDFMSLGYDFSSWIDKKG